MAFTPSTAVIGTVTLSLSDLTTGAQTSAVLNRLNNPIQFKAQQVIYEGYLNIPFNSSTGTISPGTGMPSFSVLYVRNGGASPVMLSYTLSNTVSQLLYIDAGAMFFWQTPQQNTTTISAIVSGILNFSLATATTIPATNIEVLAAA